MRHLHVMVTPKIPIGPARQPNHINLFIYTITKQTHYCNEQFFIRLDVHYRRVIYSASYGGLNAVGRTVCARGVELRSWCGSEKESSSSLIMKRGMVVLQWNGC